MGGRDYINIVSPTHLDLPLYTSPTKSKLSAMVKHMAWSWNYEARVLQSINTDASGHNISPVPDISELGGP